MPGAVLTCPQGHSEPWRWTSKTTELSFQGVKLLDSLPWHSLSASVHCEFYCVTFKGGHCFKFHWVCKEQEEHLWASMAMERGVACWIWQCSGGFAETGIIQKIAWELPRQKDLMRCVSAKGMPDPAGWWCSEGWSFNSSIHVSLTDLLWSWRAIDGFNVQQQQSCVSFLFGALVVSFISVPELPCHAVRVKSAQVHE